MKKKILHLHVKAKYFQQIANGEKPFEYRLYNNYWFLKVADGPYDEIWIYLGYPRAEDESRIRRFHYVQPKPTTITHEHFGSEPVDVYAFDLRNPITDG